MRRSLLIRPSLAAAVLAAAPLLACAQDSPPVTTLPEFTSQRPADWINSPPLLRKDLLGSVVLVDVWTYDCWNCYRSFPWLHRLESQYEAQGLKFIGIHSPELPQEYVLGNVQKKVRQFDLKFPVLVDSDHRYWNALGNQYWPAFYLVDRRGRIRGRFVGETHQGDANADGMEQLVKTLLAEPA